MKHTCYYSPIQCITKDQCRERVKEIRESMKPVSLLPKDIIQLTDDGYSVQFGSPVRKGWKSQSLFGVDIDNLQGVSVTTLIRKLVRVKLPPYAAFATLGNEDLLNPTRIHLYFALNQPVTDSKLMQNIIHFVCDTVTTLTAKDAVDYQCTDTGRLFFPGHIIYSDPSKRIMLKNVVPFAEILYLNHVLFIDRVWFMKKLQEKFISEYGIPGITFSVPTDSTDLIILAASYKKDIRGYTLKFLECEKQPLIFRLKGTSLSANNSWNSIISYRGYTHLIDIIYTVVMEPQSQNPTKDKLYYAKVNQASQPLFISTLFNLLYSLSGDRIYQYSSVKNKMENVPVLLSAFGIDTGQVTKDMLLQNVNDCINYFKQDRFPDHPYLQKIMEAPGRKSILLSALRIVLRSARMLPDKPVPYDLQHIVPFSTIQYQIHNARSVQQIRKIFQLFEELGILKMIPPEKHTNRIKNKKYVVENKYAKPPNVITLSWFDNILLANMEHKAEHFIKERKTIYGLIKIVPEKEELCLTLQNYVISLLDTFNYVTRSMLIKLIEEEGEIPHVRGNKIVDTYLPTVAARLHLKKEVYSKRLAASLHCSSKDDLTYGISMLYFREDLVDHDTDYQTVA